MVDDKHGGVRNHLRAMIKMGDMWYASPIQHAPTLQQRKDAKWSITYQQTSTAYFKCDIDYLWQEQSENIRCGLTIEVVRKNYHIITINHELQHVLLPMCKEIPYKKVFNCDTYMFQIEVCA